MVDYLYFYKGYGIERFGEGVLVFYCGDEIYFKTPEEAEKFIDEVEEAEA